MRYIGRDAEITRVFVYGNGKNVKIRKRQKYSAGSFIKIYYAEKKNAETEELTGIFLKGQKRSRKTTPSERICTDLSPRSSSIP